MFKEIILKETHDEKFQLFELLMWFIKVEIKFSHYSLFLGFQVTLLGIYLEAVNDMNHRLKNVTIKIIIKI